MPRNLSPHLIHIRTERVPRTDADQYRFRRALYPVHRRAHGLWRFCINLIRLILHRLEHIRCGLRFLRRLFWLFLQIAQGDGIRFRRLTSGLAFTGVISCGARFFVSLATGFTGPWFLGIGIVGTMLTPTEPLLACSLPQVLSVRCR